MSDNRPPEVLKPGEKPFSLPAAFVPPQLPPVLSCCFCPAAAVRRGHLNAVLFQKFYIKSIAVLRFIANTFFRQLADETAG